MRVFDLRPTTTERWTHLLMTALLFVRSGNERKAVKQSTVFQWSFIDTMAKFNFGLVGGREREREREEATTGVSNHMQFPVVLHSVVVQYKADKTLGLLMFFNRFPRCTETAGAEYK